MKSVKDVLKKETHKVKISYYVEDGHDIEMAEKSGLVLLGTGFH